MSRRPTPSGPALRRPIRWELSPKPGDGARRLARLDAADEIRFARAVARAVPFVRKALGGESHANRVLGWHPSDGLILEPWRPARRRWLREARRLALGARWVAVTDVRACYPSISVATVATRLQEMGAPASAAEEIVSWLRVFAADGVEGLPIGPVASAVLADAVLANVDAAVRGIGVEHLRWVDDVAIFAPDRVAGLRSMDALRAGLRTLGLELHEGKTMLLPDPTAVAAHLRSPRTSPSAHPR